ncbi:MAG: amino acid ABC transporter permease [Campylobacteraceae bacterium]|jgi:polar amino acid transport system permease protein|nr:amino acid ABC transporter permease [Campylobacteraceae bacterium]
MDYELMVSSIPLYAKAAAYTLYLAFCGIALSLIIGLFCALVLYFRVRFLSVFVKAYIELSRNTPLLIQLFFLHFGLKIEAHICAFVALAFLGGSYMAEAFRSGLEAVEKIQIESALSIGLSRFQLMLYVVLPQALIVSVPALGANAIFLLKETSVVSIISITDLVAVAKDLISVYYATDEALLMLVISYLILLVPISFAIWFLEKRVRYATFGN